LSEDGRFQSLHILDSRLVKLVRLGFGLPFGRLNQNESRIEAVVLDLLRALWDG
jgi:hypothetical protein